MAVESVCSCFSTAMGGFPIFGLTDVIDRVWTIWHFILGVKQWLITQSLLVMQKIVSWVLRLCRRMISTQQLWDRANFLHCGTQLVSRGILMSRKRENVWLWKCPHRWCQTNDAKNHQYELLINTNGWRHWPRPEMNLLVLFFSGCQYRRTKLLDSSRDEPAIRYEMEKKYTGVVFCQTPFDD